MLRISEYRFMAVGNAAEPPEPSQRAGLWLAEASTLGFVPGVWPRSFAVVPVYGPEITFNKKRQIQGGGWRYESVDGRAIEVLND